MTVYLLDEPFETKLRTGEETVTVTAYDDGTNHFWFGKPGGWQAGVAVRGSFGPPPPIPAAARKPKVGEVWVTKGGHVTLLTAHNVALRYWDTFSVGENGNFRVDPTRLVRPATPKEAEPFRPFMEVLMRSLGENGHD